MPGVVGDSRPGSVAAVKGELQSKFESKASLIARLSIIPDPQIKFQLLGAVPPPASNFDTS